MKRTSRQSLGFWPLLIGAVAVLPGCSSKNQISLLGLGPDAGRSGTGGAQAAEDAGASAGAGGCRGAEDCKAPAGLCDVTSGACVECLTDSNCSTYLCDPERHVCGGCSKDTDCHATTPHCDVDDHRCVQCRSRAECDVGQVCVAEAHACAAPCLSPADCSGSNRQICATAAGVCVECASNADCVNESRPPFCDLRIGSCVPCLVDRDCSTGRCTPREHRCVDCLTSTDCADGKICLGFACSP